MPSSFLQWNKGDDPSPTIYFGDILARAYAVDAITGELRWKTKVDDHPNATITGALALVGDRLVRTGFFSGSGTCTQPGLSLLHFQGLRGRSGCTAGGDMIWKSYSVDKEPARGGPEPAVGTPIYAPSGAPFWNSPTIDIKRGQTICRQR